MDSSSARPADAAAAEGAGVAAADVAAAAEGAGVAAADVTVAAEGAGVAAADVAAAAEGAGVAAADDAAGASVAAVRVAKGCLVGTAVFLQAAGLQTSVSSSTATLQRAARLELQLQCVARFMAGY